MIEEVDVDVPVRTADDQWTQFEDFPLFMDHITAVKQLDDAHVHFEAKIVGMKREWDAEITEQTPDQRVAWKATDGTANSGVDLRGRSSMNRDELVDALSPET